MALSRVTRILLWLLALLTILLGIVVAALVSVPAPVEKWLQDRVLTALRQRYGPDVQLTNLQVSVVPEFRVTADTFVLPNRGNVSLPPFITIRHLEARALPLQLLRQPVHLSYVELDDLVIQIPPKQSKQAQTSQPPKRRARLADFVIDRVKADGTRLLILPKQEGREPMEWDLYKLQLKAAGIGQAMDFTAELSNPKPPGLIHTTGKFGPWKMDEVSETAVGGHYTFEHADLSVFNGISGMLSSVGDYSGVLENIVVDGTTDTPDFKLDSGSLAVHLTTKFHAIVDGTNGNTYLKPVDAHFLDSSVIADGAVAGQPGVKGKTISLDVDIHDARIEDLLNLAASSSRPMLTGSIQSRSKLVIPPGHETVIRKIELAGTFDIREAQFHGDKAKETVAALSRRAQGRPDDMTIHDVPAQLGGAFALKNSTLRFSRLQFEVPGVIAQVSGSYGLVSGNIEFVGDVRLQAHVSDTMTGTKRVLLKPIDPLFAKHNAGTYLPINVKGNREHPEIKLDIKKVF